MIQRVKQSVFESSENITVLNIAALRAVAEPDREGMMLVLGHDNLLDGGGGLFHWQSTLPVELDDNGIAIAPDGALPGTNGIWARVLTSMYVSLSWFGSYDNSTGNLKEEYGYENLVVNITEADKGGFFQFKKAEVVNHDGVNNFHGWVRVNDPNFTADLKMNNKRITDAARALSGTDVPTLSQVMELVVNGGFVGIVPQYSPRYIGDGVSKVFVTEASEAVPQPEGVLVTGAAFEVTVDGLKLRHNIDFTVEVNDFSPNFGDITFVNAPADQAEIDIVWFAPIMVDVFSETAVTASESNITHQIGDWVGKDAKDIIIQATGTSAYLSLGDRFAANANYFNNIADMIAGYEQYQEGAVCVVKGEFNAGDGYYATYVIKSFAQAVTDNDNIQPGSVNVRIHPTTVNWVAVYQVQDYRVLSTLSYTLAAGEQTIFLAHDVSSGSIHISGPDVDDGLLQEGPDFQYGPSDSVQLYESYPAGTVLLFSWYDPEQNLADGNTVEVIENDVAKGVAKKLNFLGPGVLVDMDPFITDQADIYIPSVGQAVQAAVITVTPPNAHLGSDVVNALVEWAYEPEFNIINQTLVGSTIGAIAVTDLDRSVIVPGPISANETFTVHGESVFGNVDADVTLEFFDGIFFGRQVNAVLNEAEVKALSSGEVVTNDHAREYNFAAGTGYLYVCYPVTYGLLTRWDNLNSVGDVITFTPPQQLIINHVHGAVNYYIQRSVNQLGAAIDIETFL